MSIWRGWNRRAEVECRRAFDGTDDGKQGAEYFGSDGGAFTGVEGTDGRSLTELVRIWRGWNDCAEAGCGCVLRVAVTGG